MSHSEKPHKPTPRVPENQPLSAQEQEVLDAMRVEYGARLSSLHENALVRYVRGYKDDVHPKDKALAMLGKMITWREGNHVDALTKQTLPHADAFHRLWPSGLHGHGKDGHPILINRIGAVDGSKLMKEFTMDDVVKFHIQEMEALDAYKNKASTPSHRVYKHIAIVDLKGLSMSHLSSKFTDPMKRFVQIDQDFYPETLYVMIIVNAGMLVKAAWKIASTMLDPITKERIKFGNEHLSEFIDAANMPAMYGGHCGCAGGKCLEGPFVEGNKEGKVEVKGEKVVLE